MSKWSDRILVYKVSLGCSYLVFLIYALSFSIPLWIGKSGAIFGLWAEGTGEDNDIDSVEDTGFNDGVLHKDWMDAVRALMLVGMACYLFGAVAGLVENCFASSDSRDYGVTGVLILLAGLCGATAVIVFVVEIEDIDNFDPEYLWGFILGVIASGFAIMLSIVLLISRNQNIDPIKASRTADYVYAHKTGPYGPEYNNPGYRGDELPLVNGLPFHQPYGHSPYNMYRRGQEGGFPSSKFDQGPNYHPYGYKDTRPGNRTSMAESADLSNGFTPGIVHAEHSLGRRVDYGRPQQYARQGEYYYNGSRPY